MQYASAQSHTRSSVGLRVRFWSIVGVNATAYLQAVYMCSDTWFTPKNILLLCLSLVYSLGCIFIQPLCERHARSTGNVLYFAVQVPLVALLLLLAPVKGPGVYFILPLISQAMFVFTLRVACLLSVLLLAVAIAPLWFTWGFRAVGNYMPAYLAAFIFTGGMSYLLRRETHAREQTAELNRQLEVAHSQLRAQADQEAELAVVRERNRLAREIHDGLGHYLTTISVQAEAARALINRDVQRSEKSLQNIRSLADEALVDVRRSVGMLRDTEASLPLLDQLRALAERAGFLVDFETKGEPRELPLNVVHALLRTAQEGLTNVRKHADATRACLTVDYTVPDKVRVEVRDDGRGLPPRADSGFGLNGVRERVEALGGRMFARAGSQGGFTLSVEVPS